MRVANEPTVLKITKTGMQHSRVSFEIECRRFGRVGMRSLAVRRKRYAEKSTRGTSARVPAKY